MMDIVELAERCEAASGPDRELDRDIELAFLYEDAKHLQFGLPQYTGSMDWAMTLVPEGWRWMAGHREYPHARAYVENGQLAFIGSGTRRNPARQWFEVTAATPALALCAAALRTRATLAKLTPSGKGEMM
jgi:hypothetical protein